jgi:putative transposase
MPRRRHDHNNELNCSASDPRNHAEDEKDSILPPSRNPDLSCSNTSNKSNLKLNGFRDNCSFTRDFFEPKDGNSNATTEDSIAHEKLIEQKMWAEMKQFEELIRRDSEGIEPIFDSFAITKGYMAQVERIQIPRTPELEQLLRENAKFWNTANFLVRGRYFMQLRPYELDIPKQREKLIDTFREKTFLSSLGSRESYVKNKLDEKIDFYHEHSGRQGYASNEVSHNSIDNYSQEILSEELERGEPPSNKLRLLFKNELYHLLKSTKLYQLMPSQTTQQTLIMLSNNWRGYFKGKKKWRKDPSKFPKERSPRPPGYQKSGTGLYTATFTNQQCHIKDGFLTFPSIMEKNPIFDSENPEEKRVWDKVQSCGYDSLTEAERNTYELITYEQRGRVKRDENGKKMAYFPPLKISPRMARLGTFKLIRIVPKAHKFICEIVYEKPIIMDENLDARNVLGIDLGQKNLLAMITNLELTPQLIRGGFLVSLNNFYNRLIFKQQERQDNATDEFTKQVHEIRMQKIRLRQYNRVYNYLHNASKIVVDYCKKHEIGRIIIGYNKQWKTGMKVSKRFRKNFNPIPFYTLVKMIKYKAELVGIEVITTKEAYTSQTCAFCGEKDKSSRVNRGLYVCKHCKNPKAIHADINAAINIVKNKVPDTFDDILKCNPNLLLLAPQVIKIPAI